MSIIKDAPKTKHSRHVFYSLIISMTSPSLSPQTLTKLFCCATINV